MSVFPTAPIESPADAQPLATPETSVFAFAPGRLRAWGLKSALSLVDQGLTSAAGFGVNLLLARWLAPDLYGAFAVAFATFLFISGFHGVLLLEPLSVMGPSRHAGRLPEYFRAQIALHAILVGVLSVIALLAGLILQRIAPGSPLVGSVLGSAIVLSLLLLLWLARRMCYLIQRPGVAVAGSAVYFAFVIAGLFVLRFAGKVSPFNVFLLMGAGSLFATWILFDRLGVKLTGALSQAAISWRAVLRENWIYGKWLIGSALLNPAVGQGQVFIIAAFLGLGAAGVLRAMQLPSLVMTQVITAAGLLFLPVLSGDHGRGATERMRHKATLLSLALAGIALCFAAFLALFTKQLEQLLFAGKYAAYSWLIPILALVPLVNAFSIGYSMALRASQKPQLVLLANLVAAPVALLSALCFIRWWGLAGAAASLGIGFVTLGVVTIACFYVGKWNPA